MKVFITGSTGFVGKNLLSYYKDTFAFKRGDDLYSSLNYYKPDVIINSAAEIYDADKMFVSNIVMTYQLLEYVKQNPKTRMVHIGSSSEYGPKNKPSSETDVLQPIDFYQGSKAAATMMCQGFSRQFNLNVFIARPYSVYGLYERPHRLFPRLLRAFKKQEPMKLFAGEHDFIHIDDFVRGIDLLITNKSLSPGEIINFGSGVQTSNYDVYKLFEKYSETTAPVEYVHHMQKQFETSIWKCDTTYALNKINFKTEIDLDKGINLLLQSDDF